MNKEYSKVISQSNVAVPQNILKRIKSSLLPLAKLERGTHEGRVKVTRKGKTFYRKQRLGRKDKDYNVNAKSAAPDKYNIDFGKEASLKIEALSNVKESNENIGHVDGVVKENKKEISTAVNDYLGLYADNLDGKSYHLVSNIMNRFIDAGSGIFGDLPSQEFCDLLQLSVDDIMYQELNSWSRQLGDHGIRHIYGNIDIMGKIFDSINSESPGTISEKDKLNGIMTMIWHDYGYTSERSRSSIEGTKYHKIDSGKFFKHRENIYRKFLGDDFDDVENYIINHDTPDIDWEDHPVLSAISCADNLALFYREKLPTLFRRVEGSIHLLEQMQFALRDNDDKKFNMFKAKLGGKIDNTNLPEYTKYLLKKAAKEVSPYTPKVILSMLTGEISDIGYTNKSGLNVKIKYNDFESKLSKLYDQGQSKFVKLAETFNIKDFEKDHFEFIKNGKVLLSLSKSGKFVKIEIDIGSLAKQDVGQEGIKMENNFEYIIDFQKIEGEIEDDLVIYGKASSGELDHDGEIVDSDSLRSVWGAYMKNPVVRYLHNKSEKYQGPIGKVLPEYTDRSGKIYSSGFNENGELFVVAQISKADDVKDIRTKIKEGVLKGFSIGGRAKRQKVFDANLQKEITKVIVSRMSELSVVDLPANKDSFYTIIKGCVGENCAYPIIEKKEGDNMTNEVEKAEGGNRPPKDWMDNCLTTAKGISGMNDPAAFCGWMWYHGKESGFADQKAAIGKDESNTNDVEKTESTEVSDLEKQIENIQTENDDLKDRIQKMEVQTMEKEDNIVRMEVPELQDFIKTTIEEMTQEQALMEKAEDYDTLLAANEDLRKKIEELEGKVTAQAKALEASPQESMKDEDVEVVEEKIGKLEAELKELKESPFYKAVQDGDAPQETERHSHLGDIIKAQFGGE